MTEFIDWLENLNKSNSKVRAVLRRSLAFAPGEHIPAFPYVEPFLKEDVKPWRRQMFYLVAGLWAAHWRERKATAPLSIGKACAVYRDVSGSSSTESRFIALLDADPDQLPHRLRQMVALLKEQPLDFGALLQDLFFWNSDEKRTQKAWAKDFYQN